MTIPQRIGNYTISRKLGEGGMALIYEAHDAQSGQLVALKMQAATNVDAEDVRRFQREAQVLQTLAHPNIIRLFAAGNEQGHPYVAVELIDGGSIEKALQQRGCFAINEALEAMSAILDGLAHAHARGLIHRDIKPANVLLRTDGTPVVADFDLARPANPSRHARITADGERLGTPAYMAPEQIRGDELDARTDLYACGVMLFELLTGKLPFDGDIHHIIAGHLQQAPPKLRTLLPQASADLELLVEQMMAKDRLDRPASADLARLALQDLLAGRPPQILQSRPAVQQPPPATAPVPQQRAPATQIAIGVGVIGMVLVGIVLSLGLFFQASREEPPIAVSLGVTIEPSTVRATVEEEITTEEPDERATAQPTSEVLQRASATPVDVFEVTATEITVETNMWPRDAAAMTDERAVDTLVGGRFTLGSLTIDPHPDAGYALIYGEIRNDEGVPFVVSEFFVTIIGASEAQDTEHYADLASTIIAPAAVVPFSILIPVLEVGDIPEPSALRFSITSTSASSSILPPYSIKNFFMIGQEVEGEPVLRAISTITKQGVVNLADLRVVVTFYDTNGGVVGSQLIGLEQFTAVSADEEINFIATFPRPAITIASYYAIAIAPEP
jgi:hypothetical protein